MADGTKKTVSQQIAFLLEKGVNNPLLFADLEMGIKNKLARC